MLIYGEIKDKQRHQEIVAWAQAGQENREELQELLTMDRIWSNLSSWFPFLPQPDLGCASSRDDVLQAIGKALNSVSTLGTIARYDLLAPLLPPEERRRHLYIVGKTGSGKTTFLDHLILRDLYAGHGVGVMAPEGEFFRGRLLPLMPQHRRPDVIYFAPGDPACTLTFNPLSVEEGDDALRAAEDLFTIFRRALSGDELGPRMQPILQNAFGALVGRPYATLWDVRRLLTDAAFRKEVADTTPDPYIREFWQETFPRYPKGVDLPLMNRLDHFLRPQAIRRSLCHPVSSFSFREALLNGRVLLIDLFGLSEETRSVIGQMILSKFQLELMRRELSGGPPSTFFLYCDEFQSFAGFAEGVWRELLSRGRKYGLALTLAHQFPAQLPTALQEEIFGNVNSMVSFCLGNKDAQVVRKELLTRVEHRGEVRTEPIPTEEILELRMGEAYAKYAGGRAFKLIVPRPLQFMPEHWNNMQEVIEESWYRYGILPGVSGGEEEQEEQQTAPAPETPEPEKAPPGGTGETPATEKTPPVPQTPPEPSPTPEEIAAVLPREPEREPEPTKTQPVGEHAPPPRSRPKRERKTASPPPLGRGGPEHQYLQELVKRLGEAKGLRVTVEQPVLDGGGSVDVALERDGWRLACEISVTSTVEQEVGNVQKCLAAGFDEVVVVSPKKARLTKLGRALGKRLEEDTLARVHLLAPEEVPGYIETLPVAQERVETVGGYQVKVSYTPLSPGEGQSRVKAVAGVIARSLKRMQGKPE